MGAVFVLLLMLLFLLPPQSLTKFRVRKCCQAHEHLGGLNCVNKTDYSPELDVGWPWWFPNKTEIMSITSNETYDEFPPDVQVLAGVKQPCCVSETAFLFSSYYHYQFYDDGSLLVHSVNNISQSENITYPPLSYCVDRFVESFYSNSMNLSGSNSVDFMVQLCPCKTAVCVLKCCELGMTLTIPSHNIISDNNCVMNLEQGRTWRPQGLSHYFLLNRFPHCDVDEEAVMTPAQAHIFHPNGSITLVPKVHVSPLKFCADSTATNSTYILRCFPRDKGITRVSVRRLLYGLLSSIGAVFLMITVIVYSLLPRVLTVNDKNLMAHTWSLFLGYIGLAVSQFAQSDIPHTACTALGFFIFYSFLASFFWLNVLCIDLAWAFSETRVMRHMMVWQSRHRFLQYSLYAWLSPAVIVIFTLAVEFLPQVPDFFLKPEFSTKCWFSNESSANWAYFYGPIAVILSVNVVLFVYTSYKIWTAQKRSLTLLNNHAANEKQRLILFLKLFCLMGLSWVFELVSGSVGGPDYYWYGTDMVNLFRAVYIFVTLCCKREVWKSLIERWRGQQPRDQQTARFSIITLNSQMPSEMSRHSHLQLDSSALL